MRFGERTRTGEPLSGFGRRPAIPVILIEYLVIAGGGGATGGGWWRRWWI